MLHDCLENTCYKCNGALYSACITLQVSLTNICRLMVEIQLLKATENTRGSETRITHKVNENVCKNDDN